MRGQLIKRGSSWTIRIFEGRDENGRRRYFNETFHGNKKEAQARLTELLNQRDAARPLRRSKDTVSRYMARWLRAPSTAR